MKRKPRIFKDGDGWNVALPGYGFGSDKVLNGFENQRDALKHLERFRMFSGSAHTERATNPGRRSWHELYPMPIVGFSGRRPPCGNCGGNHPTTSCPIK